MQILTTGSKVKFLAGKEREDVIEEFVQQLKFLEGELSGKDFFGGDSIGFVDIVANIIAFWVPVTQEVLGFEAFTQEKYPVLFNWIEKIQEIDVVKECRPPRDKHLAYIKARIEGLKSASK